MLFGVGRAEPPAATIVRRGLHARLALAAGGLSRWLAERWAWLRPRIIPAAAALAGMVLVVVSLKYTAGGQVATKRHCVLLRPFAQYDVDDRRRRIGPAPTRDCRADLEVVDTASISRSRH